VNDDRVVPWYLEREWASSGTRVTATATGWSLSLIKTGQNHHSLPEVHCA